MKTKTPSIQEENVLELEIVGTKLSHQLAINISKLLLFLFSR